MVSTLTYHLPSMVIDIDIKSQNQDFYLFYSLMTAGQFLLISIYGFFLYSEASIKIIGPKLIYLHLAVMEAITFISHTISRLMQHDIHRPNTILIHLTVFGLCFLFVMYRALSKIESDEFKPNRTYLIITKPKNIFGMINYIYDHTGHKCIYQDGKIYKFSRTTGKIEERTAVYWFFDDKEIALKEIPTVRNIKSLVGKQYHLFYYNCNHLKKYAIQGT